jgi:GTP cyclohydrolase III
MTLYIAVDGDDVGRRLETYVVNNQVNDLENYARTFQEAINWLIQNLADSFAARVIFSGGDNFLIETEVRNNLLDIVEELRIEFATKANSSVSIGIGEDPRRAFLALKLAKAKGKDRVVVFSEIDK